jgi:hypothetical protein
MYTHTHTHTHTHVVFFDTGSCYVAQADLQVLGFLLCATTDGLYHYILRVFFGII